MPAPPPVPALQGHQASPQAPSDTSMEPCTDRTEGEHSALQPPCFCFPLRVALAMLFLAQKTAGGTFTSQSLRGHRNALGWMQGCPVGHTGCSQGQWPHSPVPKRKMDLTRMQGRSGHHGHTRAIMRDPPHPADLWHSTDSSPPPHHMQDLEEAAEEQRAILQREQPMSNEQTPSQLRTVLQVRRVPSSDVSAQPAQRGRQTGSALAEPS